MSYVHIQGAHEARGLEEELAGARRIALDCEAAGFHRYTDRLCLIQVSTEGETYVVDALAFDPSGLLAPPLVDPEVEVVMHGADYDLRLLHRDLGIQVRGLFDTQVAAALIGEPALGLQALLEGRLGVILSKKYQRADWAHRPLADGMLEYAANDTRHLMKLADVLGRDLEGLNRTAWAEEECRALEETATTSSGEQAPEDPVKRVRGAKDLSPREVSALREALLWRDELAQQRDRAPFRVVGDRALLEAVVRRPRDAGELAGIKGFPKGLARGEGTELLSRFDRIARLPDSELRPYPRPPRGGAGRPDPEVEDLAEALKAARNRRAEELRLDRGTLLPNAVLSAIARHPPKDQESLARVDGIRRWQVDALGSRLLEVVRQAR